MSICRMCHKSIPDGTDFCPECEQKRQNQADESYLDSLLSSVSAPSKPSVPPVRVLPDTAEPEPVSDGADDLFTVNGEEQADAADAGQAADETVPDETVSDEMLPEDTAPDETVPDETVPDETVPDETVPDGISGPEDFFAGDTDAGTEEAPSEPVEDAETADGETGAGPETSDDVDELLDGLLADFEEPKDESGDEAALAPDDIEDIFAAAEGTEAESSEAGGDADDLFDISSGPEELPEAPAAAEEEEEEEKDGASAAEDGAAESGEEAVEADGDIQIEEAEPIEAAEELGADIDPFAISAEDISVPTEGVGEATEFLGEQELEESAMQEGAEPDVDRIMSDIESGDFEREIASIKPVAEKKKEKKSLFMRLFGNIKEDRTPEQEEAYRKKLEAEEQKKKEAEELKKKRAEESKEEKAARKEQEKAEKAEKAKAKAEEAKKKKEEAKELARQKKEAKKAIEEAEIDEGQINKVGAAILVVLFGIILAIIIFGTNIYTYKLSINRAQEEFEIRHYNDAYYEVYGLDIKDEDIELYDRIMTVMYVNSQLNSYEYYMKAEDREKALDSLLKGLNKYDKYLQLATMLDIKSDLNYVKSNILAELDSEFGMSEEEAYVLAKVSNAVDYSEYIYSLLGTYEVDGLE